MPTSKPRITITLSEKQHELLSAMAEIQEVSMSSLVVELLETAEPVFERVLEMLQAAKKAPQAALAGLKQSLDFAEGHMSGLQVSALGQLDMLIDQVAKPVPGARTDGARRAQGKKSASQRPGPHPTNRGVRKTTKSPKSPVVSRVSVKSARSKKS